MSKLRLSTGNWITALFLLIIGLYVGSEVRYEVYVEAHEPGVFVREHSWFGLSEAHFEIKWLKPEGLEEEYWCRLGKDGKWYPFVKEAVDSE